MLEQSYTSRAAGSATGTAEPSSKKGEYWELSKLKKCYTDYLFSKRAEIDEQIDARRYYHGSQYTTAQIETLQKRKQPIMTFNRIGRKVDGVVGLIEKLRQDPKAYPRTPQHEEGAELATASIRYVLDNQHWRAKSPIVATDGAIDGIGGIELDLEPTKEGDHDVLFREVDQQSFFYDPRSYKDDFSDARYMGVGKWMDIDLAQDMFPDANESAFSGDSELTTSSDREMRWFSTEGVTKRARIIEIWYKKKGDAWCYGIFTGSAILDEGHSPFIDEDDKQYCKYIMFSGNVDQDGDRYGFVRNMKSAQDGINAKQAKMQHILSSKRLIIATAAGGDVEKIRREWARADGVIQTNGPVNDTVKTDDQMFDFTGLAKLLELNLAEIERFGPNPELMGVNSTGSSGSGRAISLLQQAGMAELGPYILAYRGWKIRAYRGIWNAIKRYWKAEKYIRVTDNEDLAQLVKINQLEMGADGRMVIVNQIGALDVDIIIDEAPDAVTIQAQSFEVLQALGPQFAIQYPEIAVELSPLDSATKKQIREKQQAKAQQMQPMQQLEQMAGVEEVKNKAADTELKQAQAVKAIADAKARPIEALMSGQGGEMQMEYEVPAELQNAQAMADIEETQANTQHKLAQARKVHTEASLAPQQMAMDQRNAEADRAVQVQQGNADRAQQAQQANADRRQQAQQANADRSEQRRSGDADRKIAAKKATQKPNGRPASR